MRVINARDGSEPSHALFTRVINACDRSEPSHALSLLAANYFGLPINRLGIYLPGKLRADNFLTFDSGFCLPYDSGISKNL
jgi:hypothetical protein